MKKLLYLLPVGLFFLCTSAAAQKTNIDSLKLVSQISKDQLKLGKLQNMVDQQIKDKSDAAVNAQNSANANANAAQKLNADPDNRKLANNADSKASDAKSDARKSRKETRELDDLNKNILDLKRKIVEQQAKLAIYSPAVVSAPVLAPIPIQSDTTMHP